MSVELVTVNGASVDLKSALQWQMVLGNMDFLDATISTAATIQYAQSQGISASQDEVQTFLNEFRYANSLEKTDEFNVWLADNGLDLAAVAQVCELGALRNKIRTSITTEECREAFSENPTRFEAVELYSITVESEDVADELKSQAEDGSDTFQNLAREHSVDEETRLQGGYNGTVGRDGVAAEVEADVFGAGEGKVLGPYKEGEHFSIYHVGSHQKPEFEVVEETIRDEIFEALMSNIRNAADVDYTVLGIKTDQVDDEEDDED